MSASRLACEVPRRLRTRPRDARGYPVPWIVMVDRAGRAHFPVNDAGRVHDCITRKLCGLCGKRLDAGCWFVGGPRCFTDPMGAFADPAMHEDCARYALRVCPYLAAPSYAKRIDGRTIDAKALPPDMLIVQDDDMADARPTQFMLGHTPGFSTVAAGPGQFYMRAQGWLQLETWQCGKQLAPQTGSGA